MKPLNKQSTVYALILSIFQIRQLRFLLAGFAVFLTALPAMAEFLDENPCRNGLFHIEDGFGNTNYWAKLVQDQPEKSFCMTEIPGQRTCYTGPVEAKDAVESIKKWNVVSMHVRRIALVPELTNTGSGCRQLDEDIYQLGIAIERDFATAEVFRRGYTRRHIVGTYNYKQLPDGNIQLQSVEVKIAEPKDTALLVPGVPDLFASNRPVFNRFKSMRPGKKAALRIGSKIDFPSRPLHDPKPAPAVASTPNIAPTKKTRKQRVYGAWAHGKGHYCRNNEFQTDAYAMANARKACRDLGGSDGGTYISQTGYNWYKSNAEQCYQAQAYTDCLITK